MRYVQAVIGGIGFGVSYWVIIILPGDQPILATASGVAIGVGLIPFVFAALDFASEYKRMTRA